MLPSGKLKTPVTILRENRQSNDEGELITSEWQPWATWRVEVLPLNSGQVLAARQQQQQTTHRVRGRYFPGLTDRDRLQLPCGTILRIDELIDVGYKRVEHAAVCTGGA